MLLVKSMATLDNETRSWFMFVEAGLDAGGWKLAKNDNGKKSNLGKGEEGNLPKVPNLRKA
jgi:hypothetical protein